ncbi:MAG: hypothetical protein JSS93_04230 [Bacteroidetes bacterium]|nr:hypothetical protein [Bacteroidota bacterium]MBS1981709.1 hypothetical protein [Bacteroidota bacterium]
MKYEFDTLEILIGNIKNENQQKLFSDISHETERIKKAFIRQAFSLDCDKKIELYIQRHQTLLIELVDKHLNNFFPNWQQNRAILDHENSVENINILVHQKLEELLSFIEKHFSRYFDLSSKIPDSYRSITASDFLERLPKLQKRLKDKSIRTDAIKISTEPFYDFIHKSEVKISFRKLIYLKELFTEINELSLSDILIKELEKQLCTSMIYINFNSTKFFTYCAKIIKETYQSKTTLSGQLEALAYYLKSINQQQEKPSFAYKPSLKSLKTQLTEWVIEEMIFLERKHQLSFSFKLDKTTENQMRKDFKIYTESSVSQVAYFVRILMETGLIKNKNTIEVIRFFAQNMSTNRTETISHDSFRSKFYNVEASAKEAVQADVLKLLAHIKSSSN